MRLIFDLGAVFIVLCAAASLVVRFTHHLARGPIARLAADSRSRVRLAMLFAPLMAGIIGVTVALLPSLLHLIGMANDHCASAKHGHAHLCFVHQPQGVSLALSGLVALVAAIVLSRLALIVFRFGRAHAAFGAILKSSRVTSLRAGIRQFDSELPVCLTLGVLNPKVYVSSAAMQALGPECLEAALAHEQSHLDRNETRLRFATSLAVAFHLPELAGAILRDWLDDSELICDRHAAKAAGSGAVVAEALVRFHRAQAALRGPRLAAGACLCADASRLNTRVTNLLSIDLGADETAEGRLPYLLGFGLLALGLALQARPLHHALESLVGILAAAPGL